MDRITRTPIFQKFEKPIGYKNINSTSISSTKNTYALPR